MIGIVWQPFIIGCIVDNWNEWSNSYVARVGSKDMHDDRDDELPMSTTIGGASPISAEPINDDLMYHCVFPEC